MSVRAWPLSAAALARRGKHGCRVSHGRVHYTGEKSLTYTMAAGWDT